MIEISGAELAALIAERAPQVARERAAWQHPDDWTNAQSFHDYVTTLRSIEAWTEGPRWDRTVVVCPRMHPDGGYWSYMAAEVLDKAAADVDEQHGDFSFRFGEIENVEGSYQARLRFAWPDDMAARKPCPECGAGAVEDCRVQNCQGQWR